MQSVTNDFIELSQLKEFLQKNDSVSVTELDKFELGQSLLKNKFFHDFDADGKITFSDYNIAWNWLLQGKPTDIYEFARNKSSCPETYKLPYQFIQDNDDNILLDNRVPEYDEIQEEEESEQNSNVENYEEEPPQIKYGATSVSILSETPSEIEKQIPESPKIVYEKKSYDESSKNNILNKSNFKKSTKTESMEVPSSVNIKALNTNYQRTETKKMNAIATDFLELKQLKDFLNKNNSIDINNLDKFSLGQSILNNKFFHDFDMDGYITFSDYNIAWNWVLQGKPSDILEYAQNKSASPRGYKLPYQFIQESDDNILLDNRIPAYDTNDGKVIGETSVSMLGDVSPSELVIAQNTTVEPSSDFNNDGEVDETDLEILEAFILLQPSTVEEYNANRGTFPQTTYLPNVLTAKFACNNVFYYGDIRTSGHGIIDNNDIEYYMAILNGSEPLPGENTLSFILSNTMRNVVVRTCELNGDIEDSEVCVKLQEGVFEKQNQQSFTSSLYYTLSYDSQKSTENETDIWTYSDSNISIEIGGPISNAWYIMVTDESLENTDTPMETFLAEGYSTMLYLSKEDPGATYPWCAIWDWDDDYDDTTIGDQHLFKGDTRYETVLSELGIETLQGIRKLVNEVNQGTCSDVYDLSALNWIEKNTNEEEIHEIGELRKQNVNSSEVRRDYEGPNFGHTLMTCNIRDEIVSNELHSTMMFKVGYQDYLIMKEWLRLGNPDPKNLQTSTSLIDWFNMMKRDGTPTACRLPIELYDWIGTGFAFADAYSGEENL